MLPKGTGAIETIRWPGIQLTFRGTHVYDALNRTTSITYTNDPAGTPAVSYAYDGATNGRGRPWSTQTDGPKGSFTVIDTYDAFGHPKTGRQAFFVPGSGGGEWKSFNHGLTHDRAGHLLTETYPSGNSITYTYDNAGRTRSFVGTLGGTPRSYSTDISYSPQSELSQEQVRHNNPYL